MDILADVLSQAGLQRRLLNQRSFFQAVALAFPCSRSFGFHVVVHGVAFIHTPGKAKPLTLEKGDVAFMARGFDHIVSTEEKLPKKVFRMGEHTLDGTQDQKPTKLTLVSGAYQVWNDPVHPLFLELPQWYVLKAKDIGHFDQLGMAVHLLGREVAEPSMGSDTVTNALLDVLFGYIMRRIIATQDKALTWSYAVNDPQVRAALEILHLDFSRAWTLDEMAKSVGLSRAAFAQKFRNALGATPFSYLTTIRIQKAMELLATTTDNLENVANAVGYKDAFSFSKAFKKLTGSPPREFRQKDLSERNLKWRFRAR